MPHSPFTGKHILERTLPIGERLVWASRFSRSDRFTYGTKLLPFGLLVSGRDDICDGWSQFHRIDELLMDKNILIAGRFRDRILIDSDK